MKISVKYYGETHSTTIHDDSTVDQCMRAFVNLMRCAGYSMKNMANLFKDGDPTHWDSAWRNDD